MSSPLRGEELPLICRGVELSQALVVAERLPAAGRDQELRVGDKTIPVTVSVGVAVPLPPVLNAAELIAAPTKRCTRPSTARNRVCVKGHRRDE